MQTDVSELSKANTTSKGREYYIGLWKNISHDLNNHYGSDLYKNWFSKIQFWQSPASSLVILSVPTNFIRDWIKTNYFDIIESLWIKYDSDIQSVDIS